MMVRLTQRMRYAEVDQLPRHAKAENDDEENVRGGLHPRGEGSRVQNYLPHNALAMLLIADTNEDSRTTNFRVPMNRELTAKPGSYFEALPSRNAPRSACPS